MRLSPQRQGFRSELTHRRRIDPQLLAQLHRPINLDQPRIRRVYKHYQLAIIPLLLDPIKDDR